MDNDSFNRWLDHIRKMDEQIHYSGVFKSLEEAERVHAQLYAPGTYRAIEEAQRVHDQLYASGTYRALEEAQRVHDQLYASGTYRALEEAQKMHDQLYAPGVKHALEEARWMEEQIHSSVLYQTLQDARWVKEHFSSSVAGSLRGMAETLQPIDYVINPDGTISGQNVVIEQNEVRNIIESCLQTMASTDEIGLEKSVDDILNRFAARHPIIRKFVVNFLLAIFINLFSSTYISRPPQINYDLLAKKFRKEVRQVEVSKEFYNYYRFVSVPSLVVRSNNSKKSRRVGKLHFGYLVRIVRKKRNWSLIEYRSRDAEIVIQGWVFTRYIKRFD